MDRMWSTTAVLAILLFQFWISLAAEQCGKQAGGALCANKLCCSQYGYCGTTPAYCKENCQSQCGTSSPSSGSRVSSIITSSVFNKFLSNHAETSCPANGFYTYNSFLAAADAYKGFGTTGSTDAAKRELAAFFAHVSHETTGGCYKEEINKATYCQVSAQWGCNSRQQYYGRGPLQITWNYNYGPAGKSIGFDGINNPAIVASNSVTSFKTALWFWMTQQSPTCHSAMVNNQGFGITIKDINGGLECNSGSNISSQRDRINLYKSYCQILGVDPGTALTC